MKNNDTQELFDAEDLLKEKPKELVEIEEKENAAKEEEAARKKEKDKKTFIGLGNNMKKVLAGLILLVIVFSAVGCSHISDNDRLQMGRIVNKDLEAKKMDFDPQLKLTSGDYTYEHKGASEYHLTGTAHFTGHSRYDVEVFYIFVKQSDGSFYVYLSDIGDFNKVS